MRALFLIAVVIFLAGSQLQAQQEPVSLQKDKIVSAAQPAKISNVHMVSHNMQRDDMDFKIRTHKWKKAISAQVEGLKMNSMSGRYAVSRGTVHTPLHANLLNDISERGSTIYSSGIKPGINLAPKIVLANLNPSDNSHGAGLFDCGLDDGSGLNIGLTRSACLNLDFGYDGEKDANDSTSITDFAESGEAPDLDISVGFVFGLR